MRPTVAWSYRRGNIHTKSCLLHEPIIYRPHVGAMLAFRQASADVTDKVFEFTSTFSQLRSAARRSLHNVEHWLGFKLVSRIKSTLRRTLKDPIGKTSFQVQDRSQYLIMFLKIRIYRKDSMTSTSEGVIGIIMRQLQKNYVVLNQNQVSPKQNQDWANTTSSWVQWKKISRKISRSTSS